MNDQGQVSGGSFTSHIVKGAPTLHPFLWDKKNGMRDLGTLGGSSVGAVNGLKSELEKGGHFAFLEGLPFDIAACASSPAGRAERNQRGQVRWPHKG